MEKNFKDAAFVMKVKVLSVNDTIRTGMLSKAELENMHPPFTSGISPNLEVLEVYKGKLSKKIIPLSGNEFCGVKYTVGQEYVLFIYEGKNSYYARYCEHNFLASDSYSMERLRSIVSRH